ncbi:MAG: hypothetical protein WD489_05665 [Rhodovibrionaceae bacterium]
MKAGAGIALTALCAAVAALPAAMTINSDVAWYMQAVRQWAGGDRLYIDIGDPNLPAIYLLQRMAFEIAALFGEAGQGQGDYFALLGLYALLLLAVSLFARRLLRDLPELERSAKTALVFGFPLIAGLAGLGNFAEREHWMLAALLPHALCVYRLQLGSPAPRSLSLTAALLAAVFALLKPHFLLPYLLLELYLALRLRRLWLPLRRENLIAAAVYLLALGLQALAFPAYFTEILPLVRESYGAYAFGWFLGFGRIDVWLPCALSLAFLILAPRLLPRAAAELAQILLVLALAFALLYLLQQKGWYYQFIPALAYSTLGCCLIAVCLLRARRHLLAAGGALLLPLLLLYVSAHSLTNYWNYRAEVIALARLLEGQEDRSLLHLSTAMTPAIQAAVLSHARWTYSQPQLWRLPAFYQTRFNDGIAPPPRPLDAQSPSEAAFFRDVIAAFTDSPPRVVSIAASESPPALWERDFDFLAYFLQDPDFAAIWQDYEAVETSAGHRFYLRRETPAQ